MLVNNDILHSFINCQYKAYLKRKHQSGCTSDYQILYTKLKQTQASNFEKQLSKNEKSFFRGISFANSLYKEGTALNVKFANENIDIMLDGLEYSGKKTFTPIFITPFEKVTSIDKLYLALQTIFIQANFNIQAESCKIIFGQNLKETKFKISSFAKVIKKICFDLTKSLSNPNAPIFFKNQHCQICEFQNYCLEKLIEKDDLSLLTSLKPKEILQKNNRGVFSVKQLSYSFRPKKNPYRKRKFVPELKALAIRETKTFIQEIPNLKEVDTEVFLDFEGIPDRNSNYLIGVIIRTGNIDREYSFWANSKEDENIIFIQLIELLKPLKSFTIYHYGSYEIQALKNISKSLSVEYQDCLKVLIDNSFNLLNVFTHNIYPPTYSNSLKEIARFLKFDWTDKEASGLQSTIWRYNWELNQDEKLKDKLIQYNMEDCHALKKVKEWMVEIPNNESKNFEKATNIKKESIFKWGKINFLIEDVKEINNYAYFDYQRNKIYLKTSKTVKKAIHRKEVLRKSLNNIDKEIIHTSSQCSNCGSKDFRYVKSSNRIVVDLRFMKNGIKKWVVNNILYNYFCKSCKKQFVSKKYIKWWGCVYGENIALWSIYQHIQYHLSLDKIIKMLQDVFHVSISHRRMHILQSKYVQKYYSTYEEIKKGLMRGAFIHADETTGSVKDLSTGYVWVFANIDSALYMFKRNREADFLVDLLRNFKGVLITDFYAGYDAIQCPQQKCLIHLIRDINGDLLKNQLNQEFKNFAVNFGQLLRNILETVNKYGLKKRNLSKHRREIQNYFSKLNITEFETELASGYQKRVLKNKEKLFTFIEYDGIPWNNNNAENAIKSFAYSRTLTKNQREERGMSDYLVWLSILQTCKYRGINFFEFLKSAETSIEKFSIKYK